MWKPYDVITGLRSRDMTAAVTVRSLMPRPARAMAAQRARCRFCWPGRLNSRRESMKPHLIRGLPRQRAPRPADQFHTTLSARVDRRPPLNDTRNRYV